MRYGVDLFIQYPLIGGPKPKKDSNKKTREIFELSGVFLFPHNMENLAKKKPQKEGL